MASRKFPSSKSLRQEDRPRSVKPELILCCEGENTEPHYLEWFAAQNRVLLEPGKNIFSACGVPRSVLKQAKSEKKSREQELRRELDVKPTLGEDYEVWMVIDMDDHAAEIPGILTEAREAGIRVALSNPCIELWALYHFDAPPTAEIHRHDVQRKLEQVMPNYDRHQGKRFDVQQMAPHYDKALEQARRAVEQRAREGTPMGNPSTSLHELLERIRAMGGLQPVAQQKTTPWQSKR